MRTRDTSRRPLSVVHHTRVLYPNVIVKLYIGQIAPSFCSFEPRRLYTFKWIPSAEALNKRGLRKNRNFQPIGIFLLHLENGKKYNLSVSMEHYFFNVTVNRSIRVNSIELVIERRNAMGPVLPADTQQRSNSAA